HAGARGTLRSPGFFRPPARGPSHRGRCSSAARDTSGRLPQAAIRSNDSFARNPCDVGPVVHHATFRCLESTTGGYAKVAHRLMKLLSRVVWSEGMHLGPHHFQVQSRFFEEITHFGISKLWFEPYGIVGLELDAEALRNGTVVVVH